MLSVTTILFPLLLSTSWLSDLIHAQDENGACVNACFTSNPKSSFCDGDETGDALAQCTCAAYSLTGDPQIECIQACPEDQQLIFANNLPDLCNSLLFPNLNLDDDPSSATAENTASSAAGPQSTTPAGSTTSGSGAASATSASGTASATGNSDNGAAALGLPLGVLGYAAYAAGMAAWH